MIAHDVYMRDVFVVVALCILQCTLDFKIELSLYNVHTQLHRPKASAAATVKFMRSTTESVVYVCI